jgi:hypothetical protein
MGETVTPGMQRGCATGVLWLATSGASAEEALVDSEKPCFPWWAAKNARNLSAELM